MTKDYLLSLYEKNKDAGMIALSIRMPGGEVETIINPNVAEKIKYVTGAYDDDLRNKNCTEIRIERVEFFNKPDCGTTSFGNAIDMMVAGKKLSRLGWNGKGQFVYYVPEADYDAVTNAAKEIAKDGKVHYNAYFALKTVNGNISTWIPSITDCMATDWYTV